MDLLYVVPLAGVIALIFAYMKAQWVRAQDAGTDEMQEIGRRIQEGAMAFLATEYKVLAWFVVIVAILLAVANRNAEGGMFTAVSFILGAVASGAAGYAGMKVATDANVRTTQAARTGLSRTPGSTSFLKVKIYDTQTVFVKYYKTFFSKRTLGTQAAFAPS